MFYYKSFCLLCSFTRSFTSLLLGLLIDESHQASSYRSNSFLFPVCCNVLFGGLGQFPARPMSKICRRPVLWRHRIMFRVRGGDRWKLVGRRCKYHRGDPCKRGFKSVDLRNGGEGTKRIILYPVDKRDEATLITLIERHVEKGTTIYTDGWRAYSTLNDRGYRHFSVEHTHAYVQVYREVATGEGEDRTHQYHRG